MQETENKDNKCIEHSLTPDGSGRISRRKVFGSLKAGLTAAVLLPVTSTYAIPKNQKFMPEKLLDPTTKTPNLLSKVSLNPGQDLPVK